MSKCVEYVLGSNKPSTGPAVLEAVDRFERIMEKKETIRNGMKWMENEVLQAFESAGYQVCSEFTCLFQLTYLSTRIH